MLCTNESTTGPLPRPDNDYRPPPGLHRYSLHRPLPGLLPLQTRPAVIRPPPGLYRILPQQLVNQDPQRSAFRPPPGLHRLPPGLHRLPPGLSPILPQQPQPPPPQPPQQPQPPT
ncbi:unnamed protein product [Macrosiphum euphorbiae]|uniref:Uncharacterized protein n=1 Tax=Macrosiphum euphorbiae TaxID=13131 RepID=A0AAV0WGK8_9HEMI|nr:unnamed protein product [Macrosiphum euphorbiae]